MHSIAKCGKPVLPAPCLVPPQLHLELIREKEAADERDAKLRQQLHKLEEERKDVAFINAHLSRNPPRRSTPTHRPRCAHA